MRSWIRWDGSSEGLAPPRARGAASRVSGMLLLCPRKGYPSTDKGPGQPLSRIEAFQALTQGCGTLEVEATKEENPGGRLHIGQQWRFAGPAFVARKSQGSR